MIHNRESTSRARVCESRAHPFFNQSSCGFICIIRVQLSHLPAGIFYCLPLRKYNNAAKLILPLKQNTSEGFTDELINLLCENEMISMSGAWDKEKVWVPDRIRTYDLPNTGPTLYPLELRRTHGERGHTAISRKVVGRSAHDNPERYCGWFWVHCSSRNLKEWHERPWTYVRAAKGKQQLKVGSTATVSGTVYWLYPISPFGIVVHIFSDNLSRNSCILVSYLTRVLHTAGIRNVDVSLCAEWMKDCKSSFFSWIIDFLIFKKRPNINLYLEYSWTSISI